MKKVIAMSDIYIMEDDMSIELDVEVVVAMDMVEVAVAVVISDMSIILIFLGKSVFEYEKTSACSCYDMIFE